MFEDETVDGFHHAPSRLGVKELRNTAQEKGVRFSTNAPIH